MKRILYIIYMVILVAGTVILLAFTELEHTTGNYESFSVEILNSDDTAMITLDDINAIINRNFGQVTGAPVLGIDIQKMEMAVLANPYISKCEVFQTLDRGLEMKVVARQPIVRVINEDGAQYYIDHFGYVMPLNPVRPARVVIASGNIKDRYVSLDKSERSLLSYPDSSVLHQVYPVAWHISQDEFLKSFIDQIYINEQNEIELVPKIGAQIILLGSAEDAREKLENLKTFYKKVMNQIDWNTYKSINLKYKNQVVCSK